MERMCEELPGIYVDTAVFSHIKQRTEEGWRLVQFIVLEDLKILQWEREQA